MAESQDTDRIEKKKKADRIKHAVKRFEDMNTVVDAIFMGASLIVVDILALVALVAILVSTWGVGLELVNTIREANYAGMVSVITSTLTVFIFIEVLSVSIRYLKVHTIDIKDLVDVTFAIIFRELWVGLFSGHVDFKMMLAYAALIAVLGTVRWLTLKSRADGDEKPFTPVKDDFDERVNEASNILS